MKFRISAGLHYILFKKKIDLNYFTQLVNVYVSHSNGSKTKHHSPGKQLEHVHLQPLSASFVTGPISLLPFLSVLDDMLFNHFTHPQVMVPLSVFFSRIHISKKCLKTLVSSCHYTRPSLPLFNNLNHKPFLLKQYQTPVLKINKNTKIFSFFFADRHN